MWLIVKKGKMFKENLIINENQIKTITEPKLRVTSIEETKEDRSGVNKYGNPYSSTEYRLFYNLRNICEIELIDGKKVVCKIQGRFKNLDYVIKNWNFTKERKSYIFQESINDLKKERIEDKLGERELEKISFILKNPQKEIDRKNKELDKEESD